MHPAFESLFAQPTERIRKSVEDLQKSYPSLQFDTERDDLDKSEAPFIREMLKDFVDYLNGAKRSFEWGSDENQRISSHPVYQHEAYKTDSFESLPTLNRATLRTYREPFNYEVTEGMTVYADQTSGTSGAPLSVYYSQKFMAQYLHLNMIKVALLAGFTSLGRRPVFSLRVTDNKAYQGGIVVSDPMELVGLSLIWHLDVNDSASFDRFTRMLADLDPEVLVAKPNLYRILLERWKQHETTPPSRPVFTVSGGAMLPDDLRGDVSTFFGCRMVSAYAISEAGYLGSECEELSIHLDESAHDRFECVPLEGGADGDPAAGELAVTSTLNDCMPLVRYRVGDVVDFARDICACGLSGPFLRKLQGRTTIVFDLGDGHMLSPTRYMDIFKEIPELAEYQLTQTRRRAFHIAIELREGLNREEHKQSALRVRDAISTGMPVDVELSWEERSFDSEGAKFARFRSEVVA
ncbi:hypothetical protein [Streptomyces muensis]|uniref:Uncharacterized protein n=1 Tax=Streptomyces muensis TaxID=1077944 RepID=A0A9X1Q5Q5_STRM4|nr:hypothetical protein [Streptomyces muensis]MCF1598460.1 hypothetical protein [Streptomyces muensis]